MAQYTKLLGSEIEEIARQYKLKITDYEPIEQGLGNSNYLIKTIQGKFVLTVFEIEAERVTHMIKVLKLLEKYGFPAPRLQTSVKGEAQTKYQGKLVLVKHYITGHVEKNLDAGKLSQVGAALARLHEIPAPDYLPDKHSYVTKTYPEVMEQDIDLENKYIYIHHSKTVETKPVPILDEDIELVKQAGLSFPRSHFFRHAEGKSGVKLGRTYGEKYFYKWWKKACDNLGVKDVDLYGGTRHSSVVALREHFSPEQIKQGTMHQTNKAFERYFRIGANDVREIYSRSSLGGKEVGTKIATLQNNKR